MAVENIKVGIGSLSANRDRTEERHPNYKGKIKLDQSLPAGTIIWLAAWKRDGDDGKPWLSLAASVSGNGAQTQARSDRNRLPPQPAPRRQQFGGGRLDDNLNDDIPF